MLCCGSALQAFEALGSSLEEHVTIQQVDPAAYRVFFGDGSSLDLLNDHAAMAQQLEEVEPGAGVALLLVLSPCLGAWQQQQDKRRAHSSHTGTGLPLAGRPKLGLL